MTIEETARSFIGVPWVHQGRHPVHGFDCAGLVKEVLSRHGYKIIDRSDYGPNPDGSLEAETTRVLGAPVGRDSNVIQPNDVVMMQFAPRKPRHVGIIGSHPYGMTLIHACNHRKRVVELVLDDRWRACIVGVWRACP